MLDIKSHSDLHHEWEKGEEVMENKKCFILARQSAGANDADESLSITVQVEECKKLAATHNLTVIDIFREPNTSGRLYPAGYESIANADAIYKKWLSDSKKPMSWRMGLGEILKRLDEIEYIVVYDLTRFFRPLNGSLLGNLLMQAIQVKNVKLLSLKEGVVDFNRFQDSLVSTLTSQINSEQLQTMKEKSKKAQKAIKDLGEWDSACFKSFGYKSSGRKREVEIDEFKADMVRKIFQRFLEGWSYYKISREINPPYYERTGKTLFKTHMYRILRNPIYCGYYKNSSGELIKSKPTEGKEIIDFATWKKAQELLDGKVKQKSTAYVNWLPLSGRIFCGNCGESMRGLTAPHKTVQYRCMSYDKHGYGRDHSCRCGMTWTGPAPMTQKGDYMKDALKGLLPICFMQKLKTAEADSGEELQKIQIEMINVGKKISALTDSFMSGDLPEDVFKDAMKKLSKRKQELQTLSDDVKASASADDYTQSDMLCDLAQLEEKSDEKLNILFKDLFKRITFYKDRLEVSTAYGDVTLPIKRHWRAFELPHHLIAVGEDGKVSVYWFYGDETEAENKEYSQQNIGDVDFFFEV